MKKICSVILAILFFAFQSSAQIKLPDIISDSMVLQQNTKAPIWGWVSAGEKVEVSGRWQMDGEACNTKSRRSL
jgi:sialate O-acetylesterase